MRKRLLFSLYLITGTIIIATAQTKIEQVILFTIDGLHWEAPEKLEMPVFNKLVENGTSIQKSYVIMPHHPTIGDYSKFNSCSFPNPMLHAGTIFIKPDTKLIQEVLSPQRQTAFIVNVTDYKSISKGFTTCIMDPTLDDSGVIEQSIAILKSQKPVFTRIHLQTPGTQGRVGVYTSSPDKPYFRNIFGKNSPYASAIEEADQLLGKLISYLKESGKWGNTLLIVTSDHGQSIIGWHPLFDEDSWLTPFVIVGPGIAKGRKLPYLEHTDISPTIAWLLGINPPNKDGGAGKPVKEVLQKYQVENYHPSMNIKKLNEQIKSFNILKSKLILQAEKNRYLSNKIASLENELLTPEPFYHQDRILDWYKAGSTEHLIEANEKILESMRRELAD
ncbi:hypothetical protein D1164_07650 [Mariniphaga sediminis]|uniref:Sulfatase N-terminal domain-containing protein n=1 Tax=Mariniphaga sediminis TaxID=1628158 RepID=A0A399D2U7_9BACT|nr:sulfatase-like hydrolase/transferase [Mariniphaga sediminis]RIH65538.1 hypothetical protein D1164_07650 [Mariniphaga sediminis]